LTVDNSDLEVPMRGHDLDHGLDSGLRPKADRVERVDQDLLGRAATAGRTDVLGPAGLLGLQRTIGNADTTALIEEGRSPVHDVINSGGAPLPTDTRADMEARFGQNFGDVRVHTDAAAHESAKSVNAQAYTVGSSIVFQRDNYDPASESGKHMLAHELTHVVQQRSGPVDGTDTGNGVRVSDPSDRFEREAVSTADRVMSGPAPSAAPVQRCGADTTHDDTSAQREEAPPEEAEEEPTAQTFVQRAEEEEEPADAEA
jgi:hypothetical protein